MTGTSHVTVEQRRSEILKALSSEGYLSVHGLSRRFDVSEVTIRGDLAALAERHQLVRIRGGACVVTRSSDIEADLLTRITLRAAEKRLIAAAAAGMVQDGEAIVLDASTTALAMVEHLQGHRDLVVATYSLAVANALSNIPKVDIFMIGGFLQRRRSAFFGEEIDMEPISRFNFQKIFLGAKGFTLEEGLTDSWAPEVRVKKQLSAYARQVYAVVDSSKWNHLGFVSFAPLDRIHCVITDKEAPPDMVAEVQNAGIQVVLV